MPSVTYSGNFGGERSEYGITTTLTGPALPSRALLKGATFSVRAVCSSNYNPSTWQHSLKKIAVGGSSGSPSGGNLNISGSAQVAAYTYTGSMSFAPKDARKFNGSITVYAQCDTDNPEMIMVTLREVSITIEYGEMTAPEAYTDPVLAAGQTRIKAVHMLELQSNINEQRAYNNLTAYAFTDIQAGYTSLAGWTSHVSEMRAAIDEITTEHEAWIAITENRPTAAVIEQLRRVVDTLP